MTPGWKPSVIAVLETCQTAILRQHVAVHRTEYYDAMATPPPPDPPFDPRWLDELASVSATLASDNPRLEDLYLERRLELRVSSVGSALQVEECRIEGTATRWQLPSRTVLHAASGVSPKVVSELLRSHSSRPVTTPSRAVPPAELDPPRGWREWATEAAGRARGHRVVIRFLGRQAVVVGARRWTVVTSPPLVHVDSGDAVSLLAVWRHPRLGQWLSELATAPPAKAWQPPSGTKIPVVFSSGSAGVVLHELIGHPLESDLVLAGDSAMATLNGALVTATTIQLLDDPSRFDLPGGFSCDDEGVTAEPLRLIASGRLVGWLCDRDGSSRLDGVPGRGRRASWARPPTPRLSNLIVAAGDTDPEALERDQKRGLVVTRLAGATVDPVSKRVVLRVERGWEIHHGRRRRPLAAFQLTGNALEITAHVDPSLGTDVMPDWRLGWCVKDGVPLPTGSEAPSMLVHRLEVL